MQRKLASLTRLVNLVQCDWRCLALQLVREQNSGAPPPPGVFRLHIIAVRA